MAPIAPRYRGSKSQTPEIKVKPTPLLAIPDWEQAREEKHTESDSEQVKPLSEAVESHTSPAAGPGVSLADTKGLDDYARSLAELCRSQLTPRLNRFVAKPSRQAFQAVRSVAPGIVISISVICVWWMFGRHSAPSGPDVAGDSQLTEDSFEPVGEVPLRVADHETSADAPGTALVHDDPGTQPEDQLFDRVDIIETPEQEQREMAVADDQQADASAIESEPQRAQAIAAQPNLEYEWNRPTDADPRASRPEYRASVPVVDPQVRNNPRGGPPSYRPSHQVTETRDREETYSYERTDPSTYKDPEYIVPPVAQRPRGMNH